MKRSSYIIEGIKTSNNSVVFLAKSANSSGVLAIPEAENGATFETPEEVLSWLDRIYKNACRLCDPTSIKVKKINVEIIDIVDDFEWDRALRLNAVSKLTYQEVQALDVEKYAIESKLSG